MSMGSTNQQEFFVRVGALVVASTAVLTTSFVGLVAVAGGDAAGLLGRMPYYLVLTAAAFVASLVGVEEFRRSGVDALTTAGVVAMATFLVVGLGGEGVVFAYRFPGRVLSSGFISYLLAAALVGTGLGYWGMRNWRDLVRSRSAGGGL